MKIGRTARTLARLHPLQIAARGPHALLAHVLPDLPGYLGPAASVRWPAVPEALRRLADAERSRGAERLARLPPGSRLREYEACYGLELGADASVPHADWSSQVAVEAYPASVRARRIATAIRCGRSGLGAELARAARAVGLRLEVHLLGNHLLENGLALACAGAATLGREADAWWEAGKRILAWQLRAQFLADGGHVERSASYHVALTAALLEVIELADASARGARSEWRDVAAGALGWLTIARAPDGSYPLFNDAAIDAAPRIDDVLRLGKALGIAPLSRARVLSAKDVRVSLLEQTGWARIDTPDACVFVDAGPDADGWQPGHAHADGLTFELWIGEERVVVDYGVASYARGEARDRSRSTRSHNTVELGGRDSCEVWGGFRVGRRGRGSVVGLAVHDGFARLDLEHDGYAWLPGAPRHRRLLTLRPGHLVVSDRVEGSQEGWTSRVRLDSSAARRVRFAGQAGTMPRDEVWYPRHGEARPALLFEQQARRSAGEVTWNIEW